MTNRIPFAGLAKFTRTMLKPWPGVYRLVGSLYHWSLFVFEATMIKLRYRNVFIFLPTKSFLSRIAKEGYQSQYGQEMLLLWRGMIPKNGGRFVDIGCNDPVMLSNTYNLEMKHGYRGVAVDPLDNQKIWQQARPDAKFVSTFISDTTGSVSFSEVKGDEAWASMLSGVSGNVDIAGRNMIVTQRDIPTTSLGQLLEQNDALNADVMFIDVEGHEMNVLQSYDWGVGKPRVIVVENCGKFSEQEIVRHFLVKAGYRFAGRIWIADDIFVLADG